ncbi:hypothetical protein GC194_11125 [bacterium]|nr:hypothetical protein [bacterium]
MQGALGLFEISGHQTTFVVVRKVIFMAFSRKVWLVAMLFVLWCAHANCADDIRLLDDVSSWPTVLNSHTLVYANDQNLSAAEMYKLIENQEIEPINNKASQGFSNKLFWVLIRLSQPLPTAEDHLALELQNPHIDFTQLYKITHTGPELVGEGGDKIPFDKRSYNHRNFVFDLANEPATYLMLVDKRNAAVSFPLWLWPMKAFQDNELRYSVFFGFLFGVIFIVGLVSIALGFVTHQQTFSYYGLYALLLNLYIIVSTGYAFQYIYPHSASINNYARLLLVDFIAIASIQFTTSFLNTARIAPAIHRIFMVIRAAFVALFVLWLLFFNFFDHHVMWVLNVVYTLLLFNFVCMFAAAVKALNSNKSQALLFVSAFGALILSSLVYIMVEYGLIEETAFKINPFIIGSAVEILVLAIALIFRFQTILNERHSLQNAFFEVAELNDKIMLENESLRKLKRPAVQAVQANPTEKLPEQLLLKNKTVLALRSIIYISVNARYLEYYLADKQNPVIDRNTLKEIISLLPAENFIQIHRAFVVNINYIQKIKSNEVLLHGGLVVPMSRTYKEAVSTAFDRAQHVLSSLN